MATNDTKRPVENGNASEEKTSGKQGNHPKRGFAWWLAVAPPDSDVREVVEAFHDYETPHDAWRGV